jgi:hypothetical protein
VLWSCAEAYLRSMKRRISSGEWPSRVIRIATRATSRQMLQVNPMSSMSTRPSAWTSSMKQS